MCLISILGFGAVGGRDATGISLKLELVWSKLYLRLDVANRRVAVEFRKRRCVFCDPRRRH